MQGMFAHMGGLDEIAMFVLPAAAIIFFMRRAERRAQERVAPRMGDADPEEPGADRGEPPQ